MAKITPKDFAAAMRNALDQYGSITNDIVADCVEETAKEAAAVVRNAAKRYSWKNYPKNITHTKDTKKRNKKTAWVYVKGTDYRLAHLLENGHALKRGGRTYGETKSYPHFEEGEKYIQSEFERKLKAKI